MPHPEDPSRHTPAGDDSRASPSTEAEHRARRAAAHNRAGDAHAAAVAMHAQAASLFDEHGKPELAEREWQLVSKNEAALLEARDTAVLEADGDV